MTETRDDTVTWLTQEAYDRLKSELDYLTGAGRTEIAKRIEAARDEGDLRENGGYHAAKEEQGKQEGRILQLMHILDNSRVGEPPRTDGVVGPGMTVTVRFAGDEDEVTFLLASREESGAPIDVYSPKSPLGAAISGKKVGETATYTLPNGTPPRSRSSRPSRTWGRDPGCSTQRHDRGGWSWTATAIMIFVRNGITPRTRARSPGPRTAAAARCCAAAPP